MACNGIVINLGGREICIPIYIPIEDRWWEEPDPDPWRQKFDDLRKLVTIDAIVKHISDRQAKEKLKETVAGIARSLELPEGVKLGDRLFDRQKDMAAAE